MNPLTFFQGSKALYHHARGSAERAKALYHKAYIAGSRDATVLTAYSTLLLKEGDFALAFDVATRARVRARKMKQRMQAEQNLGLAMWKMGDLDGAIALLEGTLKSGQSGTLYGTLGFLHIALGDRDGSYEKALSFNEEALAYDEEDAVVIDNVGQTLMRMERWEEAEPYFHKAIKNRPTQFDTMVCLAKCALRKGETSPARTWLDDALERPFSHLNTVDREEAVALRASLEPQLIAAPSPDLS